MGAYLSQPKTDKVSTDQLNDMMIVGASSMQGWRNSQEDAHNSILDFDEKTAFFAVYDGHGGAEVATYCADNFPQFLKQVRAYQNGDPEKALKDAFLGFDKTLLEAPVIETLKILAGEKNFVDPDDSDVLEDDEDDEDLVELHEESNLPLDEVLEKYKGGGLSMPALKRVKDCALGSKPQSPYLRGRRAAAVAADAANKAVMDPDAKPVGSSTSAAAAAAAAAACSSNDAGPSSSKSAVTKMDTDEPEEDSTVSSSSSSASKSNNNNNNNNNATATVEDTEAEAATSAAQKSITTNGSTAPLSSSAANSLNSPDSSHVKESEQNGSVTSSQAKISKADVCSSSSAIPVKSIVDDGAVSGSSDTSESKHNGNVVSASSSTSKFSGSADGPTISSTSKELKKIKTANTIGDEDSNSTDDADYDEEDEEEEVEEEEEEDDGEEEEEDDEEADEDEEEEEEDDEESLIANEQFCANMTEEPGKDSGCTAVIALLQGRDLYVANAGDSRCVVCRNGKAIDMSLDHKPEDDEESARIIKAGGRVTLDGRVNGGLNLSRAIGDHAYKMNLELPAEEQMISAQPDIKKLIISPEDEFMVLACDGIWNYMTSDEVVEFVRLRLKEGREKISEICEELFDNCLAPNTMGDGTGCDNMTAVIIRFKSKLLELPTKINPEETEDVLLAKQAVEADAADATLQKTLKRSASPTSEENSNEAENANQTKRLKTDEDSSSSNNTPNTNDNASSSTSAIIYDVDAEQKECDSVTTVVDDAHVAAVSST